MSLVVFLIKESMELHSMCIGNTVLLTKHGRISHRQPLFQEQLFISNEPSSEVKYMLFQALPVQIQPLQGTQLVTSIMQQIALQLMRVFLRVAVSQPVEKGNIILSLRIFVAQAMNLQEKIFVIKIVSVKQAKVVTVGIVLMEDWMTKMHVDSVMVSRCIVLGMTNFIFLMHQNRQ